MNFIPLNDKVLIKKIEEDEITASGIIIPDAAKEKPTKGIVIAVSSGTKDKSGNIIPLDVKEGDVVMFPKWTGTELKLDKEIFYIMKESEIFGILED